jgi:metal-responsive CopG/Arc/MetJ family transcriptional regulator
MHAAIRPGFPMNARVEEGKMSSVTIAVSVPEDLLDSIDEVRRMSGRSRSDFISNAVRAYLAHRREEDARYIAGYRRMPETDEEVAEADRLGVTILALEAWD